MERAHALRHVTYQRMALDFTYHKISYPVNIAVFCNV